MIRTSNQVGICLLLVDEPYDSRMVSLRSPGRNVQRVRLRATGYCPLVIDLLGDGA